MDNVYIIQVESEQRDIRVTRHSLSRSLDVAADFALWAIEDAAECRICIYMILKRASRLVAEINV